MIKVSSLISEKNVVVVNNISKNGAIGGQNKRTIEDLYKSKNRDHNSVDNFLSASTIMLNQDRLDNLFKPFNGLLLKAGDIYYAKVGEKDIGYDSSIDLENIDKDPDIIKPNNINDINSLLVLKNDNVYTELLISGPKFVGFVIINKTNSEKEYIYEEIYNFCNTENIPYFRLKYNEFGKFVELIRILPKEERNIQITNFVE